MSIEVMLQNLTAALDRNTAALLGKGAASKTQPPQQPSSPKAGRPAQGPTSAPESDGLTYEKDVKPFALALSKANRPALLEIYKHFGISVGTELQPEQFAEAKQMIEEALV